MSLLSREVSNWLQTNPGPIVGKDDADVYEKARAVFIAARRWRGECPMDKFVGYVNNCGYRTQSKSVRRPDGSTARHEMTLPLPAPHAGF